MKTINSLFLVVILSFEFSAQAQQLDNQWYNGATRHKDNKAPVKDAVRQKTSTKSDYSTALPDWTKLIVGNQLSSAGYVVQPAGKSLALPEGDRVMSMVLVQRNQYLINKTDGHLSVVNAVDFTVIENHNFPEKKDGGSMFGIAKASDDSTIFYTGLQKNLYVATISKTGVLTHTKTIDLSINKKNTNPLGIGLTNQLAFVALAVANQVAVVDIANGKVVDNIKVGVCPYAVVVSKDKNTVFVSNFGGPLAGKTDKTQKSAGTGVAVDNRSVAMRGSVSVIDVKTSKVIADIKTRIHPESMILSPDGKNLYVTDASGDGISIIDVATFKVKHTIDTKPNPTLPYGSLTTALAFSADGKTLYAANAGNNSIALINPNRPADAPFGFIAAGGFPGAICVADNQLYIGNVVPLKATLQKVALPQTKAELKDYTVEAEKGFHLIDILRAQATAKAGVAARPIPAHSGEPSIIKHVVYIIKENKKFDQVLGDFGKGNCDPRLVEFPKPITPNVHALASQFVLLDNYYCNGILSSDGHQWAVQGITTPYREKDFSGGHCAYDFGTDPLCYAGCGFIWDHLLRKGISFRNFGELDFPIRVKGNSWSDYYNAWKNKNDSAVFKCNYSLETLNKYSDMRYPGWDMNIPDQVRADVFITALSEYEQQGSLPEFIIIYLPNDHTQGYSEKNPTPRAYVADNDLATGRIVEALSKSIFWKDMAIFINEDDPQTGTDHVDGHRSYCLVAGPYVKRDSVISTFYNQSSVLHTICRIFGVQAMNQVVAMAPVMANCFTNTADFTSYNLLQPSVAINEMNPPKKAIKSKTEARLAPKTEKLDFSRPDLIDNDALMFSKYVWATVHGDKPFPSLYFGAHGKGLKVLGLKIDPKGVKDEDD